MHMRGTHLVARGQVRQGQRHLGISGHEFEHARVEAAHGMAEQAPQVRLAPIGREIRRVDGRIHRARILSGKLTKKLFAIR
ncbi:hypothetical protein SDC9_212149 [bioreactor metagenome]|uniref:Uncharacterized protein n=1 Tax=bioreactor metagenome TaxID=1076179 RepID=A0A645JM16_9ZZZZ